MQKGCFVIVDGFKPRRRGRFGGGLGGDLGGGYGTGWEIFEAAMKRVHPEGRFVRLEPEFYGLFEDNDPRKRLQMIVNYNTDVSQFWEWSGTGCGRSTRRTRRTSSASITSSMG